MGNDYGFKVCQSNGGNFFVVGFSIVPGGGNRIFVLKLNPYGDTIWTRVIGTGRALAAVSAGDGGVVITGDWNQAFTLKLDSNGNQVWLKFYGGSFVQCRDIKKTSDGGYIACGRDVNVNSDGYAFKVDSLGNLQWQMIYPAVEFKYYESVENGINGGYIIVGTVWDDNFPNDTAKSLITRINDLGNIVWEKRYKILNGGASGSFVYKLMQGYIFAGAVSDSVTSNISKIYFSRIDTGGNIFYGKIFPTTQKEYFGDIKILNDNKYIIALNRDSANTTIFKAKAMVTDSLGNILREKIFSRDDYESFNSVLPVSNGDFVFAGTTVNESIGLPFDVYVVRADSTFNAPPIGISSNGNIISKDHKLLQNFPNPFNPVTKIKYQIPYSSIVILKVYDVLGREVKTLVNQFKSKGTYEISFDGNENPSGLYFYQLSVDGNIIDSKKMILIR